MDKCINVKNWKQFERELKSLQKECGQRRNSRYGHISNFLYRGQKKSSWQLETTLERYGKAEMSLRQYYRLISAIKPQLETFTRNIWSIPTYPEGFNELISSSSFLPNKLPAYDYFVYLRHYSFPSPLLDWTRSPYVAAYFAFRDAQECDEQVSIYVFWEFAGHGKAVICRTLHIWSWAVC